MTTLLLLLNGIAHKNLMNKNSIQSVIDLIESSISEEAESSVLWWNIIKTSYDAEVDKYRGLILDSKNWLDAYRSKLIEKTWISSLKIKYNNASGYFIEIPKSQIEKVSEDFHHKQTLVNASRYITQELWEFQEEILSAEEKMAAREHELFEEIRKKVLQSWEDIRELSNNTAELDVIVWLSDLAYTNNYTRPEVWKNIALDIQGWRHPVIETMESDFISNDLYLDRKVFSHIITGPNMWGKSTFLRQNSLIILLAHLWSFVPAKKAKIPLTDKLFSRVWASDNLFLGQSTFMVEMQEIAYILNNATKDSFVIIDEVGRGTSTYDGLSLAWAILKENHDIIEAKTLFSTHYHELCEEAKILPWVKNFSVAVWENEDSIVFLRKIVPWAMYKSYGMEVAKLAGINKRVLVESQKMLQKLQNQEMSQLSLELIQEQNHREEKNEISKLEKKLSAIDINALTPIQALTMLHELQNDIE